ncbi:MAG: tRNA (guanosine(37)-N1)-methyltransferase TrmD [Firmicutes bacterium HGW-Firmicutes-3]|jgi:tRNA (guanine37-N1)-methyltransferase|nr:MAG: tRNA (guanosine(37)-N1)-methyltransferase TrmD [Firmicutes bacterium HGW-Firmicutes-3]
MKFNVLTLFPDMVMNGLNHSIIGKAMEKGIIQVNPINFRDFSDSKHNSVDDYPYGGGAGMVIQAQPVIDAYENLVKREGKTRLIYLTPQGKTFNQAMAEEFAQADQLTFLCGHYEGVDERIIDSIVTDEVSIGDFILTGGEMAVILIIDAVARLIPGVLKNNASCEHESFHDYLLEYPQYSRPEIFKGMKVPEVLLSGHHKHIEIWRREQSLLRTYKKRPDLLPLANLTESDKQFLKKYCNYDLNML